MERKIRRTDSRKNGTINDEVVCLRGSLEASLHRGDYFNEARPVGVASPGRPCKALGSQLGDLTGLIIDTVVNKAAASLSGCQQLHRNENRGHRRICSKTYAKNSGIDSYLSNPSPCTDLRGPHNLTARFNHSLSEPALKCLDPE
jgi:hypothetical protein